MREEELLPRMRPSPQLAEFIRRNQALILREWEQTIRHLYPARALSRPALLDRIPDLLDRILKPLDEAIEEHPAQALEAVPHEHALERMDEGFDLKEVVLEYSVLRGTVARLWEQKDPSRVKWQEIAALDAAIDQAIASAVERYTQAKQRTLTALDRMSALALDETASPDAFLPRLMEVMRDTNQAVDTAAILLREGEVLRVRAAVGLDQELAEGFTLRVGEGFAGTVAARRAPLELRSASTDPLVKTPALRQRGVRALYGVPLLRGADEVIGVAYIGSTTAYQFSTEDKVLFRAMATRATALIAQAELRRRETEARTEAQRALALLDALLEASPVGIAFLDREFRYLRINDWLAAVNGRSVEDHLGKTVREVVPAVAECFEPFARRILDTGRAELNQEISVAPPSTPDQVRTFLGSYYPVRDARGQVLGLGVAVAEITELKQASAALQESENRLRLAVEATGIGIWDFNPSTGALRWDEQCRSLLGVSPDAPVNYEVFLARVDPEDRERVKRAVEIALDPASGGELEIEYRTAASGPGPERWIAAWARVFFDEGKAIRIVGTVLDVTERKRTEQELLQTALFREQFLGVLGHDLRNPLSAIKASVDLLLRQQLSATQAKLVRRVASSADRMGRMINDVLDFTRGRLGGGMRVVRRRVNLHEIVRHAAEELQVANPERVIALELEGDGWGEWDPDRVAQVVSNLVANALQHGREGTAVRVSVRDQGAEVVLAVNNQAPPIPAEVLPSLFEPFRGGRAPHSDGLGLGLWIVSEIARAHGAKVEVRSTEDEGTTFSVRWRRTAPPR